MKIMYTHPAYPPMGINTVTVYDVEDIQARYGFNVDEIRTLFTPLSGEWPEEDKTKNKIHITKGE